MEVSGADRLCLHSLQYNEHLPASTSLPSNPFVVCLPFSLFRLALCSCHSSLLLCLSYSLVQHLSLPSPGLTVLPLLNERFANRSLTFFVLSFLPYAALDVVCFTSSWTALHFFFSLSVSLHLRLSVFCSGPCQASEQRQMKHLVCQQCWRELITIP